jgi:hypothetical protein
MIYAIKNNKVPRSIYKGNEDSLTSSIFERLMYLPQELTRHILETALFDAVPGLDFYKLQSITYWPYWKSENTTNSRNVEPDIFIRTETHDIIIEAKRYDSKQQSSTQWRNEIQGYNNEYKDDEKPLIFIALGGLHSEETELLTVAGEVHNIYKCRWVGILNAVTDVKYKMELSKHLTNNNTAVCNILDDMILCFALFGFSTAHWLERFVQPPQIKQQSLNYFYKSWTD